MRITFLAGCLEPGKDGVGDYTRLLAGECARLGATCQIISVADQHAGRPSTTHASAVEIVRLPDHSPWHARFDAIERATRWSAPHWVSLQFVPFSFHRWGLATTLVRALPRLIDPARLHVMLHEIWIGSDGSWRRRLVSEAQRRCVLRICAYPRALIHTSNRGYQELLRAHRVKAGVLPLFGSIPIADTDAMRWLGPLLAGVGCDAAVSRANWWLFVVFGTLHPVWPSEPLMGRLQQAAETAGRRIAVISIGRLGSGESVWRTLETRYGSRIPMLLVGEQPDSRISEVFKNVDFGIATTPWALLGKSGSVAAMLEHGLPVIVNREDAIPGIVGMPDADGSLVIRLDAQFACRLIEARRAEPQSRRSMVAARFLADLKGATLRDDAGGGVSVVA